MAQTIVIICLAIFSSILITVILYLRISHTYKVKIEKVNKEVKQIRKQLLAKNYRELREKKLQFEQECAQEVRQINLDRKQVRLEKEAIKKSEKLLTLQQKRLDGYELAFVKRNQDYDYKLQLLTDSLAEIATLSKKEAKDRLMQQIKHQSQKEMLSYLKNVELETYSQARTLANNIIVNAMERYATEIVNQKTTNVVKLPNDEIKGRVIGREGRNLRALEQLGGVDILIDETPGVVTVSSFNPIRREIATKTLEKLVADGRIQPVKIEIELKRQEKELDSLSFETGRQTIQELGITDMEIPLVKLIGRLKYRTSYGQNALQHSIEVAKLAGAMAAELRVNINQAIRAGLLHDIGKALDFEAEGSHVVLGTEIARQHNEDEVVINAIEAHHEDVPKNSLIASLVAIADTISAARPGARNNSLDEFFKRMNQIERLADQIPGVDKIYAFQSGRQIRVIVDPNLMGDQDLNGLLDDLKHKILTTVIIPGEILITIIREQRLTKLVKK